MANQDTVLVVKNNLYILKKCQGDKVISEIIVDDRAKGDGISRDDMVSVMGNTSNFTKEEIEQNLFNVYNDVNKSGKTEVSAEYAKKNGQFKFAQGKKFSMGSLFDTVESKVTPKTTAGASNSTNTTQNQQATSGACAPLSMLNNFVHDPGSMPSQYATGPALNLYNDAWKSGIAAVGGGFFNMGAFANMYQTISNYVDKMFNNNSAQSPTQAAGSTSTSTVAPSFGGVDQSSTPAAKGSTSTGSTSTGVNSASVSDSDSASESGDVGSSKTSGHRGHKDHGGSIDSNYFAGDEEKGVRRYYTSDGRYVVEKTTDGTVSRKIYTHDKKHLIATDVYKDGVGRYATVSGDRIEKKYTDKSNNRVVERYVKNGISSKIVYTKNGKEVYFTTKNRKNCHDVYNNNGALVKSIYTPKGGKNTIKVMDKFSSDGYLIGKVWYQKDGTEIHHDYNGGSVKSYVTGKKK